MATRMLTAFTKAHGYLYLRNTLSHLLTDLCNKPPDFSFELDPSKVASPELVVQNLQNLKSMAQAFLDAICDSSDALPP